MAGRGRRYALVVLFLFFFFVKQKTAYEMLRSLVGSEMCIRDRGYTECPKEHFKCMRQHNPQQVIGAIHKLLADSR